MEKKTKQNHTNDVSKRIESYNQHQTTEENITIKKIYNKHEKQSQEILSCVWTIHCMVFVPITSTLNMCKNLCSLSRVAAFCGFPFLNGYMWFKTIMSLFFVVFEERKKRAKNRTVFQWLENIKQKPKKNNKRVRCVCVHTIVHYIR